METLERWLYRIPEPPRQTRHKPMRVLALGISRSGTESLSRALRILGYDHVFHGFEMWQSTPMLWHQWTLLARRKWGDKGSVPGASGLGREDFDALLGHCEAITDQPGSYFAPELIAAYPEAKVILNRRDVISWHHSLCTVLAPLTTSFVLHVLPWFYADLYWESRYMIECQKAFYHGSWTRHGKWVYDEHSAVVRGSVEADRLLEWSPEDGWEPLCRFLGKDIPDEEFPSGNKVDNVHKNFHADNMTRCIAAAMQNFTITIVCLGGIVGYSFVRNQVDLRWIRELDFQRLLRL
ncbi:P-loop containing nucleoside triphosphate hydrolase protein [Aspergillus floccosus]